MGINILGQQRAVCELGLVKQVLKESEVGLKAFDLKISQCAPRLGRRAGKLRTATVNDDFGEQRIIAGAGLVASIGKAIDSNPNACRRRIVRDLSSRGFEKTFFGQGFHIHPALNCKALCLGGLGQIQIGKACAIGNFQLQRDQIKSGDALCHSMLDLQPGIGLDEEIARGLIRIDQEFEGAQAAIVCGLGHADGILQKLIAGAGGNGRARGNLNEFLVLTLHRAVPLPKVDHAALAIP